MNRKVLLIEDDAAFRMSVALMFKSEPYEFLHAESPEEGILMMEADREIRVILLDLSFVHQPGTAVLDHITRQEKEYRVIVLTGHDELLRAERAGQYDVFNYLPKTDRSSKQAIRFSLDQAFKDLERRELERKIDFLLAVQKKINENCDLRQTLNLVCRSVLMAAGAYTCHIRVYDFRRGDYHLKGFASMESGMEGMFEQPRAKGDLFSGKVVESGQSATYDDLQQSPEFLDFAEKAMSQRVISPGERRYWKRVRSAYIVPISTGIFKGKVDAVLNIGSQFSGFFAKEKCELVDEFVSQAALSITKVWLQRKRAEAHEDYGRIASMLNEMSGKLRGSGKLSIPEVLREVYDVVMWRISEIVCPEVISIFLKNERTGFLENVAELRGSAALAVPNEVYNSGQSLTGWVYSNNQTIQLPDPSDRTPRKPWEDGRYDFTNIEAYLDNIPSGSLEHYLAVPIRIGGKVRGVLRVMNKKSVYYDEKAASYDNRSRGFDSNCLLERGFSQDCRNVIEITASHLAVAIENAELLGEKEHQVERVQALQRVGRLFSAETGIEGLLDLTIRKMAEVMKPEICMLFLKEGEDRIVLRQCFGMPMIRDASYQLGEGVTGHVAMTGIPRLIRETDKNDGKYDPDIVAHLTRKYGTEKRIESLMIVPIRAKSSILGAMKVINKTGDHSQYSEKDLPYFSTFAESVGVAIENAQDYERTKAQLATAERNAELSLLVSAVAHEINNTSGLIPANVDGIREALRETDEGIERMLDVIEDVATQATDFANELAGFSATSDKRARDINDLIRNTVGELECEFAKGRKARTIHIELTLGTDPLICEIYRRPFIQVVRNIVVNAYQAIGVRKGGFVRVSTRVERRQIAVIEFEDNGPGIRPEHRGKIFDASFSTKAKGSGVGLWLVRNHLNMIGGSIEVESEPDEGARFIVRLPLGWTGGGTGYERSRD